MSYIPEYHENYYRVEGTAFNQGKIGIGTINPVQLLHVSGGNIRVDGTGYINGDLNVTGNLNVYGTTAQFAVSQVIAEDKSLELNVATGTPIGGGNYTTVAFTNDAGAEDGGLILKSTQGDKILAYKTTTPANGWVSNQRWIVSGNYGKDTLQLSDTNANVGLTIGTDANNVNLYRSANDTLTTDDNISSTYNGGKTTLALTNTTANVGMTIGADTNLYRSGTNTLRTDSNLGVVSNFNVDGSTILGDSTSDTVSFNARANTNLEPSSNNTRNLGSSALNWGTAFLNNLRVKSDAIVSGYFSGIGSGTFSDGSGFITTTLLNNPLSVVGSGNNYMQLNIQNSATGDNASADLVITANNGTDNSNFINLGINNSGYNQSTYSNGTGFDGYLFINGGDLDIGTQTTGKVIEFHVGGTTQEKTIARINQSGLAMISGYILSTVSTGVTAGTDAQGTAFLNRDVNVITTNASNPGAVTLITGVSGFSARLMVRNATANPLKIYPALGAQIDASGLNAAGAYLTINTQKEFYSVGTGQWYSI
jgi:hypothetical protein